MKTLTIGDYYAPDLTALTGLTGLEVLNRLERLNGVEPLQRLITLSVRYNDVTDLSPLAGVPQPNYLQLEGLAVTDFSARPVSPPSGPW